VRLWVGITDHDWYQHLSGKPAVDEVNFWQPSAGRAFRALQPGEPFLFKLHSPNHFIVGGGFLARYSPLPVELAWEAFGEKNGASSLEEMRLRIAKYRRVGEDPRESFTVGCIVLIEPFFSLEICGFPFPRSSRGMFNRGRAMTQRRERDLPSGRPSKSVSDPMRGWLLRKPTRQCGVARRWFANDLVREASAWSSPKPMNGAAR